MKPDDSLPENAAESHSDPAPQTVAPDENATEDEALSLDQLGQAYARVLQDHQATMQGPVAGSAMDSVESGSTSDEAPESAKADSEDLLDDASCEISPRSILEAVLFVGAPKGTRLTAKKLAGLMRDVEPREIRPLVKELNELYEADSAPYRIVFEENSYQMRLAEEFEPVREKFYGEVRAARLSQSAIDVLAIVAYNQPVTVEQVDKMRLRPSRAILTQLVRRQLLTVTEAQDGTEQPKRSRRKYQTTTQFLKLFELEQLGDLPQSHEIGSIEELAG